MLVCSSDGALHQSHYSSHSVVSLLHFLDTSGFVLVLPARVADFLRGRSCAIIVLLYMNVGYMYVKCVTSSPPPLLPCLQEYFVRTMFGSPLSSPQQQVLSDAIHSAVVRRCPRVRGALTHSLRVPSCPSMCACVCACVGVGACVLAGVRVGACARVCVCLCVRAHARVSGCAHVCICMCLVGWLMSLLPYLAVQCCAHIQSLLAFMHVSL